jgi:hypothetical protein
MLSYRIEYGVKAYLPYSTDILLLTICLQIVLVMESVYLGRLRKYDLDRLYYNVNHEIQNMIFL